jgi:hypothetical protein
VFAACAFRQILQISFASFRISAIRPDSMNKAVEVGHTTAPQFNFASAFTVAELGEMLPKEAISSWRYFPGEFKDDAPEGWRWKCFWNNDDDLARVWGDTEADARAKMLIYLVENKRIRV